MTDPLSSVLQGQGPSPTTSAPGPNRPDTLRSALPGGISVGAKIQIQPIRLLSPQVLEVQIRGADASGRWGSTTRAELAKPLPAPLLKSLAPATTPGTARAGPMPLEAEVLAVKPALTLRIITPETRLDPRANSPPAPGTREWLGQQLRQHWPESRPVAATLQDLAARLAASGSRTTAGPTPEGIGHRGIEQSVASIVERMASPADLTDPQRLAGSLAKSGIWLESALARLAASPGAPAALGEDLKAQLLTLAQMMRGANLDDTRRARAGRGPRALPHLEAPDRSQGTAESRATNGRASPPPLADSPPHQGATSLRRLTASLDTAGARADPQTPGQAAPRSEQEPRVSAGLARDVDGMIKQIVTNQLQALGSNSAQPHWVLELPFRAPTGLIALEADIKRERAAEGSSEERWSMQLRLDLPQLGSLVINLMLRGDQLSASLQAGTEQGAKTLTESLSRLRTQLEARDIQVAGLHAGFRPSERPRPPFDAPLVSEEA